MRTADRPEAVRIAGRARERELLGRAVAGSARGEAATVLVHGEAGVGKTRLVTAVTEHAREAGHAVLWGRCLRFGAASSPYLPFVSAFQRWLAEGHETEDLDLERLEDPGTGSSGQALQLIDRSVGRLAATTPVVLVVDDLQWADVSSLDALAYLIAGAVHRRLSILVTYRDEGLPDGHVLHEWLADMVRMPGVVDLPLGPLDLEATREQLELLLGAPVSADLAAEVTSRSGGNAYLTELLARDLDPRAERLPPDLPHALRTALLARWHALSAPTRGLAQVLAVAGRPAAPTVLREVADAGPVEPLLHEAEVAGVVRRDTDGLVWFRHPLLSEVLYATLLDEEARTLHREFVAVLLAQGAHDTRARGDLALHYVGARLHDEAFEHCLLAADEALAGEAYPEVAVLLRGAVELWPDVSEGVRSRRGSLPALLAETAWVCRTVGDFGEGVTLIDRALELVDPEADPATAAEVLMLRAQLRWIAGLTEAVDIDEVRRAVEVSRDERATHQHVLALADLADCHVWRGEVELARLRGSEAVAQARRLGDTKGLCYALGSLATARMGEEDGEALAREAVQRGLESGSSEYTALAVIGLYNVLDAEGRFEEAADVLIEGHRRGPATLGLTHLLGIYAATALIPLGRLVEARELLRAGLASRSRGMVGIQAREHAAVVALRQGDLDEAETHLVRVRELAEHFEDHVGLHGPGVQAEYLLAAGRPTEVLELLERTIETHTRGEPKYGDALLLLAVRAAAELPRRDREPLLAAVLAARDRAPVPRFADEAADPGQRAVRALFDAEMARCRRDDDVVARWRVAVARADEASLRYAAAEARLRLAEALLVARERGEAAQVLREAHEVAEQMAAWRLRDEVAAVATAARIPLDRPAAPSASASPAAVADLGLTRREVEILGHLVAGRTYAEIARALVISEKTVSVHVSNVLRKTGTASRIEAAAWARRSGAVAG